MTLKIRSRSPKSDQLFAFSYQCIFASLVIHVKFQKRKTVFHLRCNTTVRRASFWSSKVLKSQKDINTERSVDSTDSLPFYFVYVLAQVTVLSVDSAGLCLVQNMDQWPMSHSFACKKFNGLFGEKSWAQETLISTLQQNEHKN